MQPARHLCIVRGMPTNLERARARAGLSQESLAQAARVARMTIVRAERGQTPARFATRYRIAQALGLQPEDLWETDAA